MPPIRVAGTVVATNQANLIPRRTEETGAYLRGTPTAPSLVYSQPIAHPVPTI